MKKTSTLLEQALQEEKRVKISNARKGGKKFNPLNPGEVMKFLLPNYKPHEKMEAWHSATQLEKGIRGGVGSGKTWGLAANDITVSYINRPYLHISMAPTWDSVLDFVIPALETLCNENGLVYEWRESRGLFRIFHGQGPNETANILLLSGEGFNKGITAASGSINEPFSISKKAILVFLERIRYEKSRRLETAWGGTAEPESMDWGGEYFEAPDVVSTEDLYTTRIETYDNRKHLAKGYIEKLEKKYDSKLREVYLKGKHVNLTQLPTYHQFLHERNINHNPKVHNLGRGIRTMILSFDFNVNPMCCGEITKFGKVYIQTSEWKIENSNTAALCTFIIDSLDMRYPTKKEREQISLVITGDASGRQRKTSAFKTDYRIIMDAFENSDYKFTMYVPEENPRVRDRVNVVNALMEMKRFLIDASCKYSITDRGLVQWKESAEGFVIDKRKADRTHMSEAVDYGLMVVPMLDNEESEIDVYSREQR